MLIGVSKRPVESLTSGVPSRLLAELAERWLETREWPQSEVQVQVARASLFTTQAIALDMIATGRKNDIGRILEHVATIVPGVAPGPLVEIERARREAWSGRRRLTRQANTKGERAEARFTA